MSKLKDAPAIPEEAKYYQTFCAVALLVLFFVRVPEGTLAAALFALTGIWGIVSRMRLAPILLLIMILVVELGRRFGWGNLSDPDWAPRVMLRAEDVLFCIAVLGYIVGHYRLQSLTMNLLPLDPRQRIGPPRWHLWPPKWTSGIQPVLRSGSLVTIRELGVLIFGLPLAALGAQLIWSAVLSAPRAMYLDFEDNVARTVLLAWTLVPAVLVIVVALGIWKWRRLGREAAAQFLQDVLWRETRREQRRIERWTAWRRLRQKEES